MVKILLIALVTIMSAEKSSKLKIIKYYLWSCICQGQLTLLSMIWTENEVNKSINFGDLINEFIGKQVRKIL